VRPLPTTPSRYIVFDTSWTNPNKHLWYIVEHGVYTSFGFSSLDEILTLWAADPPATVYDELQEEFVPLVLGA